MEKILTIIESKKKFQFFNLRELYNYKDLMYFLVLREIKVLYKQTILGFSWAIIRPLFSMVIFSIVFGGLAKIPSDGIPYPVFSYTALVPWIYFSSGLTKSSQSLIGNLNIFTKVYFPRIFIPLSPIISGIIDMLIALGLLFVLMLYYNIMLSINIIWLPLLILIMLITTSGLGFWLSALAVQFRDVRHAITFLTQLMMYSAPVVWPSSMLLEKYGENIYLLYGLYPMAGVIEGFRCALLGTSAMPWSLILIGSFSSILIFISGLIYFKSKENIFADVV